MDYILVAGVAAFIAFGLGVIFAKQVLSEAASLKSHITAEIASTEGRLRADLQKLAGKL